MTGLASGDRINYSLRPAKSVERKMIKDIISQLHPFDKVSDYRYIGFGSKYFSDFKLFHRALHLKDMISIEKDGEKTEKYAFNRPFECIDIQFGTSTDVLGTLQYDKKFVAWLDYDTAIEAYMLDDVATLIDNVQSGSLILVSYNAIAFKLNKLIEEFGQGNHAGLLRSKFEQILPPEYVPMTLPTSGLSRSSVYSQIVRSIFISKIENALASKNAALQQNSKWKFEQVAYFNYKDGADMSTLGWIFYKEDESEKIVKCAFQNFEFYSSSEEACNIEVPNFTIKELRHMQEFMPLGARGIDRTRIHPEVYTDEEVHSFAKIYKYFPSFVDIEVA